MLHAPRKCAARLPEPEGAAILGRRGKDVANRMRILLAMVCLCLAFGLGTGPAESVPSPIWADSDSLERHRISGETRISVDGSRTAIFATVPLEVTVDEEGRVADVRPSEDYERTPSEWRNETWLASAMALVRQWRFRPFTRDGRTVVARGNVSVAVLPAERLPSRHIPFPDVAREQVVISMDRSGCYGSCPAYSVEIHGDGRVELKAQGFTLVEGKYAYAIPVAEVEALIRQFREADFWSLDPSYEAQITDQATTRLTFKAGAVSKTVTDYVGTMVGMPEAVRRLQDAVDRAADTAALVTGNERTIARLEAARFDFRSRAGIVAFLWSIGKAPDSVPLAFLDRGLSFEQLMRVSPWQKSLEPAGKLALFAAVEAGRVAVFDRLDRTEIFDGLSQEDLDGLLLAAAHSRSQHLVKRMLARGGRPGAIDKERGSALIRALDDHYRKPAPDADQEAIVRLLLRRGVPLEATDGIGWTALQHAYDDDPRFARMLIAAGAKVDAVENDDDQPLLYLTGDEEIALIAIEAGADLGRKDSDGRTLAEIARRKRWLQVQALVASASRR